MGKPKFINEWLDQYGETIKPGDSIRFMTLYGTRIAEVKAIRVIPDPMISMGDNQEKRVVAFEIDSMQVGPEQNPKDKSMGFAPLTEIESHRMWNAHKDIGRQRDWEESLLYKKVHHLKSDKKC